MRIAIAAALLLAAALAFGAVEISPGPWTLYRGTSIVQPRVDYPSLQACADAAGKLAPRAYSCRTIANVVVTSDAPPPPPPVNCAVSAWGAWQPGAWGACSAGTQSRTETRSRTITTQPANGGTACPAISESRTVSQSCTVAPSIAASLSVSPTSLPAGGGSVTLSWSCSAGTATLSSHDGSVSVGPSGSYSGNESQTKTWTLTCRSGAQTGTATATLSIGTAPPPPPPPVGDGTATISWIAPGTNTDNSPITGPLTYRVYAGRSASALSVAAETNAREYEVTGLAVGQHYFGVTAVVASGTESAMSEVASKTVQ